MVQENITQPRKKTGIIALGIFFVFMVSVKPVHAEPRSSANYQIPTDVLSGGVGITTSLSYINDASIAQVGVVKESSSSTLGKKTSYGFWPTVPRYIPDVDEDDIGDAYDNCTLIYNPDQRDTNKDGYGNMCDGDLNNDKFVNSLDLVLFKQVFFTKNPDADFNGDGFVNSLDLVLFKKMFFNVPGPSGFVP